MGNYCSGKQAKKDARTEDRPGEREPLTAGGRVAVELDGIQMELKEDGATVETRTDPALKGMKDRAKELAQQAEVKALARQSKDDAKAASEALRGEWVVERALSAVAEQAEDRARQMAEAAESFTFSTAEARQFVAEKVCSVVVAELDTAKHSAEGAADSATKSVEVCAEKPADHLEDTAQTLPQLAHVVTEESVSGAQAVKEQTENLANSVQDEVSRAAHATEDQVSMAVAAATSEFQYGVEKTWATRQEIQLTAVDTTKRAEELFPENFSAQAASNNLIDTAEEWKQAAAEEVEDVQAQAEAAAGNVKILVEGREAVPDTIVLVEEVKDKVENSLHDQAEVNARQLTEAVQEGHHAADDTAGIASAQLTDTSTQLLDLIAAADQAKEAVSAETAQDTVTAMTEEVHTSAADLVQDKIKEVESDASKAAVFSAEWATSDAANDLEKTIVQKFSDLKETKDNGFKEKEDTAWAEMKSMKKPVEVFIGHAEKVADHNIDKTQMVLGQKMTEMEKVNCQAAEGSVDAADQKVLESGKAFTQLVETVMAVTDQSEDAAGVAWDTGSEDTEGAQEMVADASSEMQQTDSSEHSIQDSKADSVQDVALDVAGSISAEVLTHTQPILDHAKQAMQYASEAIVEQTIQFEPAVKVTLSDAAAEVDRFSDMTSQEVTEQGAQDASSDQDKVEKWDSEVKASTKKWLRFGDEAEAEQSREEEEEESEEDNAGVTQSLWETGNALVQEALLAGLQTFATSMEQEQAGISKAQNISSQGQAEKTGEEDDQPSVPALDSGGDCRSLDGTDEIAEMKVEDTTSSAYPQDSFYKQTSLQDGEISPSDEVSYPPKNEDEMDLTYACGVRFHFEFKQEEAEVYSPDQEQATRSGVCFQITDKEKEVKISLQEQDQAARFAVSIQVDDREEKEEVSFPDQEQVARSGVHFQVDDRAEEAEMSSPEQTQAEGSGVSWAMADEETLQKIAAEVTRKAVQDAIRIVTEGGLDNNDLTFGSKPSNSTDLPSLHLSPDTVPTLQQDGLMSSLPLHQTDSDLEESSHLPAPPPPSPTERSPGSTPKERSPVPSPKEMSPVHSPKERSPVPSPKERSPVHSPKERSPVPSPKERSPVPSPKERSPVPSPKERSPVHSPKERSPVPSPKERSPVPSPKERSPVPSPKERSPVPSPKERSPVHSPKERSPDPSPKEMSSVPSPKERSPVLSPNERSPAHSPTERSPSSSPKVKSPIDGQDVLSADGKSPSPSLKEKPESSPDETSLPSTEWKLEASPDEKFPIFPRGDQQETGSPSPSLVENHHQPQLEQQQQQDKKVSFSPDIAFSSPTSLSSSPPQITSEEVSPMEFPDDVSGLPHPSFPGDSAVPSPPPSPMSFLSSSSKSTVLEKGVMESSSTNDLPPPPPLNPAYMFNGGGGIAGGEGLPPPPLRHLPNP